MVDWAHAIMSGHKGSLADAGGYGERILPSVSNAGCRTGSDVTFTFPGHAGRTVRVAITWNSHAARPSLGGDTVDRRKSDLDLGVRTPVAAVIQGAATSRTHLDASNI